VLVEEDGERDQFVLAQQFDDPLGAAGRAGARA